MSENITTDTKAQEIEQIEQLLEPVTVTGTQDEANAFEEALDEQQVEEVEPTVDDAPPTDEAADEPAPEVKKVVRRKPATPKAPAAKPAPQRRRKAAEEDEAEGEVFQSREVPADIVGAGQLPRIGMNSTRNMNRISDLHGDPLLSGTAVKWNLLWKGEKASVVQTGMTKKTDFGIDRDRTWIIFLGTDPRQTIHWLVGTKGRDLVEMKVAKTGTFTFSNLSMKELEDKYDLGTVFSNKAFRIYQLLTKGFEQYNYGAKRAAANAAKLADAKKKADAKKVKSAPAQRKVAPAPTKRVVRRGTKATASK
jgi:hypothetical protein